jgi:hypothetical protein
MRVVRLPTGPRAPRLRSTDGSDATEPAGLQGLSERARPHIMRTAPHGLWADRSGSARRTRAAMNLRRHHIDTVQALDIAIAG